MVMVFSGYPVSLTGRPDIWTTSLPDISFRSGYRIQNVRIYETTPLPDNIISGRILDTKCPDISTTILPDSFIFGPHTGIPVNLYFIPVIYIFSSPPHFLQPMHYQLLTLAWCTGAYTRVSYKDRGGGEF